MSEREAFSAFSPCPAPHVEAEAKGENDKSNRPVRSSSVSRCDSLTTSTIHGEAFSSLSRCTTRRESFATTVTTDSRVTSPLPHDPREAAQQQQLQLDDIDFRFWLPRLSHGECSGGKSARTNNTDDYNDNDNYNNYSDDGGRRSGSCSRWLSRFSSFSVAAGSMTPLAWKMSSSLSPRGAGSPRPHATRAESALEHTLKKPRAAVAAGFFPRDDCDDNCGDEFCMRPDCGDDGGDDVGGVSPPRRERSMAPAELVAERARRRLQLE